MTPDQEWEQLLNWLRLQGYSPEDVMRALAAHQRAQAQAVQLDMFAPEQLPLEAVGGS